MSQNTVHLLLGSNLNSPKSNLETAQVWIEKEIGSIEKKSDIIETEPEGFVSEFNFLNQIIVVQTEFSPISVLKILKNIEQKMGRVYIVSEQKYQDRIIDIDILTFNEIIFDSRILKIPHHQIISRNFVKNTALPFKQSFPLPHKNFSAYSQKQMRKYEGAKRKPHPFTKQKKTSLNM